MGHPLASEIPTKKGLAQEHAYYMSRLAADDRELSETLTKRLNMAELFKIAGRALGSECYDADKIYQGGFNQIFDLTFRDENINVIARINMPHGGGEVTPEQERRDRVASEAATLMWLKHNTSVPVPCVFVYNSNPSNPVGAAFIIQERINGRPLTYIWHELWNRDRKTIVEQIAHIQLEIFNTSFPEIGSLFEDVEPSGVSRFYIGRRAPPVQVETAIMNRGPWKTPREQLRSFITELITELDVHEGSIRSQRREKNMDDSGSCIEEFRSLYAAILNLVNGVELLNSSRSFSLSHPDFTLNNILVGYDNPTRVVGLIDWEGARVQPWWQTSPIPSFIWDEIDRQSAESAEIPDGSGGTWDDVTEAWGDIFGSPHDPVVVKQGFYLAQLYHLVIGDYAKLGTTQDAVDFVMEWRLQWPDLRDPAFAKLDEILRNRYPDFNL